MAEVDASDLAQRAAAWLASPEGQQALRESTERALQAAEKLCALRPVDWREMHRPVTI